MYIDSCLYDTYSSTFHIEGDTFFSVHQYVSYQRARGEGNQSLATKIKNSRTECELRALDLKLNPMSHSWRTMYSDYRFRAVLKKFRENPSLRYRLLNSDISSMTRVSNHSIDTGLLGSVKTILAGEC